MAVKKVGQSIEPFKVSLPGRSFDADLNPDVMVSTDPEGLGQALADQPGRFAWWGVLEVEAKAVVEGLENRKAAVYADLYDKCSVGDDGERRSRAEDVKTAVARDPAYRQVQEQLRQANRQAGLLGVAKRAMEHRKEALLAIASNYRAELDAHQRAGLRLRESVYKGRG